MSPPRRALQPLYIDGNPVRELNSYVRAWLAGKLRVREHKPPAAFGALRLAYELEIGNLRAADHSGRLWDYHRSLQSNLTDLMYGHDLSGHLSERLSADNINPTGFRTALAQGVAKNTGENFTNAIVLGLSSCLEHQDEVLIDKGIPPPVRPLLTLEREFITSDGSTRRFQLPIESDIAIWARDDPSLAIIVSAKTRLKEVFHIATMWKLLFDMIGDEYCMEKWRLKGNPTALDMTYVFATADMIPAGGARTQGPDVERQEVRNLIGADASFFDYVFVSKTGIGHVSSTLDITTGREALFHELGCLFDLVEQKFSSAIQR